MCKRKVKIWILAAIVFAAPATFIQAQQSGNPIAVLSDVSGKVLIKKAQKRESLKAVFGMQLMLGDQVSTDKNSKATMLFSNGNLINLGASSSITISGNPNGGQSRNIGSGLAGSFSDLALRQDHSGEMGVLMDLRSDETVQLIIPLSPCNTMISDTKPILSWESGKPADEFVVSLYNSQGLVWEKRTKGTSLEYPKDEAPLQYGESYFWNVEGEELINTFRSLNQKFTILPEEKIRDKEAEEEHILALFEEDPQSSSCHSLLGACYARIGLLEDAIREFQLVRDANPDATLPHEILGNLYRDVGKKDLAIAELQQALALEKEK